MPDNGVEPHAGSAADIQGPDSLFKKTKCWLEFSNDKNFNRLLKRIFEGKKIVEQNEKSRHLWPVQFVAWYRKEVDVHLVHVDVYLPYSHVTTHNEMKQTGSLSGVGMKEDLVRTTKFPDTLERLDHSNFVVNRHYGHKHSLRSYLLFQYLQNNFMLSLYKKWYSQAENLQINNPVFLHWQVGHIETFRLKLSTRVQNAFVLLRQSICQEKIFDGGITVWSVMMCFFFAP